MIRFFVMAGQKREARLRAGCPAIHVLLVDVDARDKPGHDEFRTRKAPAAYAEARLSPRCLPLGLTEIPDFTAMILPADFPPWPLKCLPFSFTPFALAPFSPCCSSAFAASFSAFLKAFLSALAFRRVRSARASARFFLRFFSHAAHLQPIGFR